MRLIIGLVAFCIVSIFTSMDAEGGWGCGKQGPFCGPHISAPCVTSASRCGRIYCDPCRPSYTEYESCEPCYTRAYEPGELSVRVTTVEQEIEYLKQRVSELEKFVPKPKINP